MKKHVPDRQVPGSGGAADPDPSGPVTSASAPSLVRADSALDVVLPAGTEVEAYVIQTQLGTGGLSHVYRATHVGHGRPVAIKVLSHGAARSHVMVKRFFREVRAINTIRHPNIAEIYDVGRLVDGRPFYVMELVEGQTLSRLVRRRGRVSVARACAIIDPVGDALGAAHEAGIVHRDIKPGNILIGDPSDPAQVKLIDFGVAKLLRSEDGAGLTAAGQPLGTPSCMAPEQVRCDATIDHRADIYGLGATLFFLLTGAYPFGRGSVAELEQRILSSAPRRPSELAPVPPAVDRIVLRCLEKDPDRRYTSTAVFLHALRAAVAQEREADTAPVQVVGVFVEAFPTGSAAPAGDIRDIDTLDDIADDTVDEMDAVLRRAGAYLAEYGFLPVLETGTGVLCAFVIRAGRAAAQQARAVSIATNLYDVLANHPSLSADVGVCVSVHVDSAEIEQIGGRERVTGGPITTTTWVAQPPRPGVVTTDAARRALDAG